MADDDPTKYKVGYKRPPKEHQFKKGAKKPEGSGRKKGVRNSRTIIEEINEEEKEVMFEGKRRRMSNKEYFLRRANQLALTGTLTDKVNYVRLCEMVAPGSADPQEPLLVRSIPGDEGL